MGNRGGAIHNEQREIVRPFKTRRWITCVLQYKDRHRTVMAPGRYTELFFLDEAVSFAAGHRPCAECRHGRFKAFQDAWRRGYDAAATADRMDTALHRARIDRQRRKVTYTAALESLPNGCLVSIAAPLAGRSNCVTEESAYLVWNDALFLWTPDGYVEKRRRPTGLNVTVLTPEPVVHCFRHGYEPETHDSRWTLPIR